MRLVDLDTMNYAAAWDEQCRIHDEVAAGGEEAVVLVEHPPTITLGRRAETSRAHLRLDPAQLAKRRIELVESDRGGDVTYHGPGQLVAYPIVRLADRGLSVGGYMKLLQEAVIATLAKIDVDSHTDECAVGVWVGEGERAAKVCAMGVRVRRGVTLHGLALNVETDLSGFDAIVPCGLERPVTSLRKLLGPHAPSFLAMKTLLGRQLLTRLEVPADRP